jgi:hypothetical protein
MVICRGAWQCARDQFPRYADHCGLGLININIGFNFSVLSEHVGGRSHAPLQKLCCYTDHCGLGLININIGFNFSVLSEHVGGRIAMRPYRNYAVTPIIVGWV